MSIHGGDSMKKRLLHISKVLFAIVMSFMLVGMNTVTALTTNAPDTVKMGVETLSPKYLGGTEIGFVSLADGTVVFCLKALAPTPNHETLTRGEEVDGGVRYILQHGYPNVSITGEVSKDRYITQIALWWYLDRINGYGDDSLSPDANLSPNLKITGEDPYGVRPKAKSLMEQALQHRNDKLPALDFQLKTEGSALTLSADGTYYQSGLIWITSNAQVSNLVVSANGAPAGTKFVDQNGKEKTTFSPNDKFRVIVPASSVKDMTLEFSIGVGAKVSTDTAYVYKPSDSKKQSIAITYTKSENVTKTTSFNLIRTGVKISKQDIATNKELAGAKLVIKDQNGNVVEEWVSTGEPHYIYDLPTGTYTLEEVEAPEGYQLSTEKIEFEITKDGLVKEVVMYNSAVPEVPVPDTGVNDGVLPIAGASMMILGIGLVYRHAKKRA